MGFFAQMGVDYTWSEACLVTDGYEQNRSLPVTG